MTTLYVLSNIPRFPPLANKHKQKTNRALPSFQKASQGTAAVVQAVTNFNRQCPNTKIVLIGYSQGGQIMDNAFCGGAGSTLSGSALAAVKAAIFLGDPRYRYGLSYNTGPGTCRAQGVSAHLSNSRRVALKPQYWKS